MRNARTLLLVATLMAPTAASAQAQPASTRAGESRPPESETPLTGTAAQAQVAYERGLRLYDDDHFEEALGAFREALAIYPSPNPRLYIARCLRELGRIGEAVREYELTARRGEESARLERRYALTRDAARAEMGQLDHRVGRVRVRLYGAPATVRMTIAGAEIAEPLRNDPIAVTPGRAEVVVEAEGYETARGEATVEAAGEARVDITMRPQGSGGRDLGASHDPVLRNIGIVSLGVGVAGLITFGVFSSMAGGQYSMLEMQCGSAPCPPSQRDAIAAGRTYESVGGVGLGFAIVGLAAGTTLIVLAFTRPPPPAAAAAPRASVSVFPTANGLAIGGSF